MSIILNGKTYYRTAEACQMAGISKNTFLRWVREGRIPDTEYRDRRGWRLFGEEELQMLRIEVNTIRVIHKMPECDLLQAKSG